MNRRARAVDVLLGMLLIMFLPLSAQALTSPLSVAFLYSANAPLDELHAFDIAVVDPDHGYDPVAYRAGWKGGSELFAYVAVGEVHPSRSYADRIPQAWHLASNTAWGSIVIDQAQPEWPAFFAEQVVAPLWAKGYRGLFLDTLDSYRLKPGVDEAAQQRGLVAVIRTLRTRFPGIRLMLNRGFEFVPEVKADVMAVAAESLFGGWDAAAKRYVTVPDADRQWLLEQLRRVRDQLGLPVIAIDYVAPVQRDAARDIAKRIAALGITPWVADGALATLGVGEVEVLPRKVLVLYDGREANAINYTNAHRYLEMPLNHLGYTVEYVDVNAGLPETAPGALLGRYAGIVTWFSGGLPNTAAAATERWMRARIADGMHVAVFGDFGFALHDENAAALGLRLPGTAPAGRLSITRQDPVMGFEHAPLPDRRAGGFVRIAEDESEARTLLGLTDAKGNRFDPVALTRWGGYALNPFAVIELPGTNGQSRWIVDPFAFLTRALRLPPLPVPDTTTENGRRLLFAHIDGDGFASRTEFGGRRASVSVGEAGAGAGAPVLKTAFAAEVLLTDILQKYRIPHAMSVIEAEVGETGIYKDISPQLEAIARRMFALSNVEIASHTFSHPFHWDKAESGVDADDPNAYYAIRVPNYAIDLRREIEGSVDYIRRRLAPPGKPVRLLFWSGDAAPGARSLAMADAAGLLNLNGGVTAITRSDPSLTGVYPLGISKQGHFQTYAPVTNENLYTNLWRSRFYGFERVIETFELTDRPRRLKPIDIYYHTYSASKLASLKALHKVYAWALAQPTMPIFPSEFVRKALDFNRIVLARRGDTILVRGAGELRTLRAPASLGMPDVATSSGLAGYLRGAEGYYLHLADGDASLRFAPSPRATAYLAYANARLADWQRDRGNTRIRFAGNVPLELALANVDACEVSSDAPRRRTLRPTRRQGDVSIFVLNDAAATISISCRAP